MSPPVSLGVALCSHARCFRTRRFDHSPERSSLARDCPDPAVRKVVLRRIGRGRDRGVMTAGWTRRVHTWRCIDRGDVTILPPVTHHQTAFDAMAATCLLRRCIHLVTTGIISLPEGV
jgi:hypothetical protein